MSNIFVFQIKKHHFPSISYPRNSTSEPGSSTSDLKYRYLSLSLLLSLSSSIYISLGCAGLAYYRVTLTHRGANSCSGVMRSNRISSIRMSDVSPHQWQNGALHVCVTRNMCVARKRNGPRRTSILCSITWNSDAVSRNRRIRHGYKFDEDSLWVVTTYHFYLLYLFILF